MSRYHRCDPRSDYDCPECAQDQVAYEREAERTEPMAVVRERLEAIRERHGARLATQDDFLTYSDAEAALASLSGAHRDSS